MKVIIFGGFEWAVRHEMDQNAIFHGVDYFVDNDPALIGTTYLGKEVKHPQVLLEESADNILILVGSIEYWTELAFQLKDMGFVKDVHFMWAIAFTGNEKCKRLWKYKEWKDNEISKQKAALDKFCLDRYKTAMRLIDIDNFTAIIDMGAYTERLKEFIPDTVKYIPVDYVKWTDQTILCDLNNYEFPVLEVTGNSYDPKSTCIISIGNIAYAKDWKWYLRSAFDCCSCLVIENNDFVRMNRQWRMENWTRNNAIFDHELILYAQKCGFILNDAIDFRLKHTLYKFIRTREWEEI